MSSRSTWWPWPLDLEDPSNLAQHIVDGTADQPERRSNNDQDSDQRRAEAATEPDAQAGRNEDCKDDPHACPLAVVRVRIGLTHILSIDQVVKPSELVRVFALDQNNRTLRAKPHHLVRREQFPTGELLACPG